MRIRLGQCSSERPLQCERALWPMEVFRISPQAGEANTALRLAGDKTPVEGIQSWALCRDGEAQDAQGLTAPLG